MYKIYMATAIWVLIGAAALYGLHRIALWMECKGWIYYRKRHGSSGGLGTALLEMQAILESSKRYMLEIKRSEDVADEDSGDKPKPGRD